MEYLSSPASGSGSQCSYETSQSPMSVSSVGSPQDFGTQTFHYLQNSNFTGTFGTMTLHSGDMNMPCTNNSQPFLEIIEQPQDKFRFRYVSEMHGTHGCILGVNKSRVNKTYPSVELKNFNQKAIIRCSLYSIDPGNRVQHPHTLVAKIGSREKPEPHDLHVPCVTGYRVEFQGIGIIHTARKNVVEALIDKMSKRKLEELGHNAKLTKLQQNQISDEACCIDAKKINLNSVCLCFEAFVREENGAIRTICPPVFSNPIHNMKSALTGELRICRIDATSGRCSGGDQIFIFVEKVNRKNIRIRFYEVDEDGNEVWEDYGRFNELDVHHQYAIAFLTPPYRDTRITSDVEVYLELKRPSDGLCSESKRFTYKPMADHMYGTSRKRAREEAPQFVVPETVTSVTQAAHGRQFDLQVQIGSSPLLNTPAPTLPPVPVDNFEEIFPSHTTPSFEQFLRNMDDMESTGMVDYLNLLEVGNSGASGTSIPGNPNIVADAWKLENNNQPNKISSNTTAVGSDGLNSGKVVNETMDLAARKDLAPKTLNSLMKAEEIGLPPTDIAKMLNLLGNTKSGITALHTSVEFGQSTELETLLRLLQLYMPLESYKKIINSKNHIDQTALHCAILYNRPEMVTFLLLAGSDVKLEASGRTPLQLALDFNNAECFTILIKHINDAPDLTLDQENRAGRTVLHEAIIQGNLHFVRMLIDAGADPNACDATSGSTALHLAVEKGSLDIVQYLLLNKQVNVNAYNSVNNTPLHIACVVGNKGSLNICKQLIEAGANPWLENLENRTSESCDNASLSGEDEEQSTNIPVDETKSNAATTTTCSGDTDLLNKNVTNEVMQKGKTAFDLAVNKAEILKLLNSVPPEKFPKKEKDMNEECPVKSYEITKTANMQGEIELSCQSLDDFLDSLTFSKVAKLLHKDAAWKDVAQCLELESSVPRLEASKDPAGELLQECMGKITTKELRDLLEVLNQAECVVHIDAMLARQVTDD